MKDIQDRHRTLKESFSSNPRSVRDSKDLLSKFRNVLSQSFEPIAAAVKADFNKPQLEFYVAEFGQAIAETNNIINNLESMLSSPSPKTVPVTFSTMSMEVEKIALGTVLIISPFNYPLILSISPLVGAIAAGNNVVLKLPYDQLPNFSRALTEVLESVFPPEVLLVVGGGVTESTYLLNECKFDKIFFTGSTKVGKIVYEAASKNLTPVVLELGGKSPVFITKNIDLSSIDALLDRLLWGKFSNAGQTCVAPDYVLVDSVVYEKVMNHLQKAFEKFSKIDNKSDYSHVVNQRNFDRLNGLIESTKGDVIGGRTVKEDLFIAPTIVSNIDWNDPLMCEEIFGPILPIIKYDGSFQSIIKKVTENHDTPLAAYLFSSSEEDLTMLRKYLRSGSILVNETLMSAGCFVTPFGGIGSSGFGNYHSKWSIDTFTHERAVLKQPLWAEFLLAERYYPYTEKKLRKLMLLSKIPEIPFQLVKSILFYCLVFICGYFVGGVWNSFSR